MNNWAYILTIIASLWVFGSNAQPVTSKYTVIKIQTSGHCGQCKINLEKGMTFEKGVKEASFDQTTGILTVHYHSQKTNPDKLRTAVTMIGYDADSLPADPKAYEKLQPCCKKGGMDLMK